jgi:hypothetical protein
MSKLEESSPRGSFPSLEVGKQGMIIIKPMEGIHM